MRDFHSEFRDGPPGAAADSAAHPQRAPNRIARHFRIWPVGDLRKVSAFVTAVRG
jgi:hypothetical protein